MNAIYMLSLLSFAIPGFLVHLSRRLKCTIVIMRCPSSVRPSSLTFHILDFSSETAEQNLKKLDRKQDFHVLYQVCVFRADRKNEMAALASDWLRHFRLLLWNHWTEFNETWQEARSQRPLQSLCFTGRSEKQDGRPGLWLAETFSTSPLKPLNRIQRNLIGSKISTSSTKFVFFRPIEKKTRWPPWPLIGWDIFDFSSETAVGWMEYNETWQEARSQRLLPSSCFSGRSKKTRWPPWPLIGRDIFDFSSETTEPNLTKLDRKQDLNVLYQFCVFLANRKNKMAALASDWLRHFWLLLWNRWRDFDETWQEARFPRLLPSLCFLGRSEKQDGRLGLWLAETFSTSPLKPLNGLQRNLTGRKISKSFTKFVFFWPIGKTRWPPWPIRQKGGILYSGARNVALWASCFQSVGNGAGFLQLGKLRSFGTVWGSLKKMILINWRNLHLMSILFRLLLTTTLFLILSYGIWALQLNVCT